MADSTAYPKQRLSLFFTLMTALLFLEEAGKLRQLETGVSDILHQLDAILQDQIQQQTAGISVECYVAFTNGCYEVVLLAVEHQGN